MFTTNGLCACNKQILIKKNYLLEKPKIENTHEYSDHDDDLGKEEANLQDSKVAEPPLKFEDIVHGATYDKMRPPKPGGKIITIITIITSSSSPSLSSSPSIIQGKPPRCFSTSL